MTPWSTVRISTRVRLFIVPRAASCADQPSTCSVVLSSPHLPPKAGSKWALRGISQCWQAELRPHGIRVVCVCPSEVQTGFGGRSGRNNPNKLYARDIGATIMAALEMPRRALWPELAVFATNPWKED